MYLLKLSDYYIGIDGKMSTHQSDALRIPSDIKRLFDTDMGFMSLMPGYRFVKLRTKPAPVDPSADIAAKQRAADELFDYADHLIASLA